MKTCDLKEINKSLVNIDKTISKFAAEEDKKDEKRDNLWTVTRGQGERLKVVEDKTNCIEHKSKELDDYLNSKDDKRPGVLQMIDIRLQRLENTITMSNSSIKEELYTFKNFIMKIIYSIGGGITALIGIGGLISWFINIIK